jgi:exosome complex RNA-binding protein Rrp42 (RNase PH superfamily)
VFFCSVFGLQDGSTVIIDPNLKEEAAMQCCVTIMVNPNNEVCAVHKAGGVGLTHSQLFRCESPLHSLLRDAALNG